MESKAKTHICSRCKQNNKNGELKCPYCGKIQWQWYLPVLLIFLIPTLICIWALFNVVPGITNAIWRGLFKWSLIILGGFLLLCAFYVVSILFEKRKPGSVQADNDAIGNTDFFPATTIMSEANADMVVRLEGEPPPMKNQGVESPAGPRVASSETESMVIARAITDKEYDKVAEILLELDKRSIAEYSVGDKESCELTRRKIRSIGTGLNEAGDEDLMRDVLTRAANIGCNARFVEREWNGIGTWWG